jgi:hypothetical protein
MKRWFGLALLVFVATAGWRIGDALSPDALSMAIGVLFGVMAGVPAALLVMAGSRRRHDDERKAALAEREQRSGAVQLYGQPQGQMAGQMHSWGMPGYAQQPPIIVVAGPQGFGGNHLSQPNMAWMPSEPPARHFTVVGDREEFVEEW